MRRVQIGVALISTMVVVTVVTMAAVALAANQRMEIRRVENILGASRGEDMVERIEARARELLSDDQRRSGFDASNEDWATAALEQRDKGFTAQGELRDLQGVFNLNNLVLGPGLSGLPREVGSRARREPAPVPSTPDGLPRRMQSTRGDVASDFTANDSAAARAGPATNLPDRASASASSKRESFSDLPPKAEWTREDYVEALSRVYDTTCQARGQSAGACEGAFADNVNAELASAAVERAIARASGEVAGDLSSNVAAAAQTFETPDGVNALATRAPATSVAATAPQAQRGQFPPDTATSANANASTRAQEHVVSTANSDPAVSFRLLLQALDIDTALVQAIQDWLDPDSETRFPNGAEDDFYLGSEPPYRAANRAFADVRELRLIRGMDEDIFSRIKPHITVLPERTAINVNTATPEILMSLAPQMSRSMADQIVSARRVQPFQSVQQFTEFMRDSGFHSLTGDVTVNSQYFELVSRYTNERLAGGARSLLHRHARRVAVVQRQMGYFP